MKKPKPLSKYARLRAENALLRRDNAALLQEYWEVLDDLKAADHRAYKSARERVDGEMAHLRHQLDTVLAHLANVNALQPPPIIILERRKP